MLLGLNNVEVVYDRVFMAVTGVSLQVPGQGIVALLGANGAGKSTTLRTIMGLTTITGGKVRFRGEDITGQPTPRIARKGIAFVPEDMGIFSLLTVRENMVLAAVNGPLDRARLDWVFDLFPPLKKFWDRPAGNLSGGQKQMLAIARAIIEPRELLLVDEPTKGLAPAIINDLAGAFEQLKQQQVTVLLVEQNFNFSRRLGQSAAVMNDGGVVWSGQMTELADNDDLQHELLGLGLGEHQ